jgi:hypothetical protein
MRCQPGSDTAAISGARKLGPRQAEQVGIVRGCASGGTGQDLAQTRAELEAVSGEPGGNDEVAVSRQQIDDEVAAARRRRAAAPASAPTTRCISGT